MRQGLRVVQDLKEKEEALALQDVQDQLVQQVNLVQGDHLDQGVNQGQLGQLVREVRQEHQEVLEALVLGEKLEVPVLKVHLVTEASQDHQVLLDLLERQDPLGNVAHLDHLDRQEVLDHQVSEGNLVLQDQLDQGASQEALVNEVRQGLVDRLDHRVPEVSEVKPEALGKQEVLVQLVKEDSLDLLDR